MACVVCVTIPAKIPMELYDAMRTAFSAREFTDEPVPDEVLVRILENARFAPSGGNRQAQARDRNPRSLGPGGHGKTLAYRRHQRAFGEREVIPRSGGAADLVTPGDLLHGDGSEGRTTLLAYANGVRCELCAVDETVRLIVERYFGGRTILFARQVRSPAHTPRRRPAPRPLGYV
jgi:hypothetical protein